MITGQQENKDKKFRSRYSVVLVSILLFAFVSVIQSYLENSGTTQLISLIIFFLVLLLIAGFRYQVHENKLLVKIWFVTMADANIKLIQKVERSYIPLSSISGSLKRLGIYSVENSRFPFLLISPAEEQKFIEALRQINPEIVVKVDDKKDVWRFWDWDF